MDMDIEYFESPIMRMLAWCKSVSNRRDRAAFRT
jgi:hypothetical protein